MTNPPTSYTTSWDTTRCDNRTPAVLAPAVAPKPETGLAGPPNGLQHYSLKMLALSTRRDGPDCVLLLVSEALRHRQVALVDEIKHHYRARAPADAVPLRSRRHARMRAHPHERFRWKLYPIAPCRTTRSGRIAPNVRHVAAKAPVLTALVHNPAAVDMIPVFIG